MCLENKQLESAIRVNAIATSENDVFESFSRLFNVQDSNIFEIGGALEFEVLKAKGVKKCFSFDPLKEGGETEVSQVISKSAEKTGLLNESCDYVFSCNAFEHIINLKEVLEEARRVLKPKGILYSHFGPIWSAPDGHHLDVQFRGENYNFWERTVLPHWAHLTRSQKGLFELLTTGYSEDFANVVVDHVYKSKWLNRLCFEDYIELFVGSGLSIKLLHTTKAIDYEETRLKIEPSDHQTSAEVLEILSRTQPFKVKNIFCRDILVILEKA